MGKYICPCDKEAKDVKGVTIKIVDNKAVHDVKCSCDKYMELSDPKAGIPGLGRMNKYGSSY